MSAPNDGGPAFPYPGDQFKNAEFGMTLRDYFAAAALQAIVYDWCRSDPAHYPACAVNAYKLADAMLAERAKGGTP